MDGRAHHGERVLAGVDRAVRRVIGSELGVPRLDDDLAAGDAALGVDVVAPRLHGVDRSLEDPRRERRAGVGHHLDRDVLRGDADIGRLQRCARAVEGGGRRRRGGDRWCRSRRPHWSPSPPPTSPRWPPTSRGGGRGWRAGAVVAPAAGRGGRGEQQCGDERRRSRSTAESHGHPPCEADRSPPRAPSVAARLHRNSSHALSAFGRSDSLGLVPLGQSALIAAPPPPCGGVRSGCEVRRLRSAPLGPHIPRRTSGRARCEVPGCVSPPCGPHIPVGPLANRRPKLKLGCSFDRGAVAGGDAS